MEKQASAGFWLSPQQSHVWSMQQGTDLSSGIACSVRIEGSLRPAMLQDAVRDVILRHEVLRTVFRRRPGMKFPFQLILESSDAAWETVDLSGLAPIVQDSRLQDLFRSQQNRHFNLEEVPQVYASLAKLGPQCAVLIVGMPALLGDSRSLQNMVREVGLIYADRREELVQEPLRYVQFSQWQKDLLEADDEATQQAEKFWNKQCASDLPELELPLEGKSDDARRSESFSLTLDPVSLNRLEAAAVKQEASVSNFLLACWQSLLWRLTGQSLFSVGALFDGREYEELHDVLGLCAKSLPIPARLDGDVRFRDVVEHVRDTVRETVEWQEHYAPGNGLGREPSVGFDYLELPAAQEYGGVTFRWEQQYVCSEGFKLKLGAQRSVSGLTLEFHFDSSRLERVTVERFASYFQTLLRSAVENPETPVSRLPLLSDIERQQLLVQWNQTAAAYPKDRCLHELFEAQVERTPDRVGLRFEERQLSYGEWNERANRLAHYLRHLGVGPDSLVGLCVERSAEMMVAVLAILKAGGAYVPLNADNPKPRLAQQLSGVRVLLTQQKLLPEMPEFAGTTLCLDRDETLWSQQPRSNPPVQTSPENLVYVIYTSGSTGIPKGVGVRHRNLVNYAHFICGRLELEKYPDGLHFATVSTLGADLGNTCIYPALISGGCLHVISYEVSTDSQRWAHYCAEHPIDVLKIVPSHLQALLNTEQGGQVLPRKYLILGGETLSSKLVEKIQELNPVCEILNHYGPTETTVGSLTLAVKQYQGSDAGSIPIGRPIANTRVYILDGHQQPVPVGVVGELYIAGAGVAAGYVNQPERTAERFLLDPFVAKTNPSVEPARMYRTGDLARYLLDGKVEFLGRGDDQIKIRGFRIELGEIESVLAYHHSVKQAVVVVKEDERGDKRLLAYVVRHGGSSNSTEELRAYLKEQLPDYMAPAAIVSLSKLPLTTNGKIDRQALPAPEQIQSHTYIAPRTPTEEVVAHIWAEVLRRDRISTEDNFFELGGHSLMATQIVSRVREHFRIELAMRVLFERPTIREVAEAIATAQQSGIGDAESAIVPVARESYRAGRS